MIPPKNTGGLNVKEWAKWRKELFNTGSYDPNDWDKLNSYQKDYTQDTLNTLKDLNENYDTP